MRRRGPDGSGVWWSADRRVALGHRRLAILDLSSRAAQPMTSADGRLAITYNGEIYNFPELRAELERDGRAFPHELRYRGAAASLRQNAARRWCIACAACSPSRSGTTEAANCFWRAIPTASNRSIPRMTAGRFVSPRRSRRCSRAVGFRAIPNRPVLPDFICSAACPSRLRFIASIRALPAGHTQIVDAGGPREPRPFASLAAVLAEGARDPAPGRRTRGTGARRRARQRPGAPSRRCRDRRVSRRPGSIPAPCWDCCAMPDTRSRARSRCNSTNFAAPAEDEAPLAAEIAARYGAEHIVRRVERERVRARSAGYSRRDGSAVDRRGQYLVRREGRERGRSQGRAVGDRRRRTAGRLSELSATCRDGVACSDRLPPFRGSGVSRGCCCAPWRPGFCDKHPKAAGLLEYSRSWADAYLLRRGLFLPVRAERAAGSADGARGSAPAAPAAVASARR